MLDAVHVCTSLAGTAGAADAAVALAAGGAVDGSTSLGAAIVAILIAASDAAV